ncbi:unnamed protein product [Urochloa humidicola]
MEPPPRQRRRIAAEENEPRTTTIVHDVPDDLLRQILLRLDSPLWLVRAACSCKLFRRAVAAGGRAFLRLAASLHPPVVVGHYHESSVCPTAFVPSSPAPPIDGSRFSLDFLPCNVTNWEVADCHGGLVLLRDYFGPLQGLIVCDPLTRRYHGIPHPPDERAGFSFSLLDGDDDISVSNFRVLCRFQRAPHVCFFFSTASGCGEWRFLRQSADHGGDYVGHVAGRVDGSLCLGLATGSVKVLDNTSLEPSDVDLPIHIDTSRSPYGSAFTVIHGAGRDPTSSATTWMVHVYGEELEFFRRVCGGRGGEWVLEHSIPKLSEAARGLLGCPEKRLEWAVVNVIAVGTGIAVLQARDRGDRKWLYFSVDMDTKELKVVPNEDYRWTRQTFTYTLPWRQFLRACPSY